MLCLSSNSIPSRLAAIFNSSLEEETLPDATKLSVVMPIYKQGNIHDMNNYRPIALLSLISKVLEK